MKSTGTSESHMSTALSKGSFLTLALGKQEKSSIHHRAKTYRQVHLHSQFTLGRRSTQTQEKHRYNVS